MTSLSTLAQTYADRFENAVNTLPGNDNRSIVQLRKAGLDKFLSSDFPNKRVEEWRFTNLGQLIKTNEFTDVEATPPLAMTQSLEFDHEIVFVDGRFSEEKSKLSGLPEGVRISSLSSELGGSMVVSLDESEDRSLYALNTAFMEDGFFIFVDDNVQFEKTLGIRFENSFGKHGRHIRNRIILGDNARLNIVETHTGQGSYLVNPITQIVLSKNAKLTHYKLQNESEAAYHIALTDADIADNATYKNFTFSIGAKLSRNELTTAVNGEEAESHLNGAYLMKGSQHCDNTTLTEHRVPNNSSNQVYKGVLDGKGHGVFQGKIKIFEDAQQVTGDQLSKALLLSDDASVSCKPELEIYADDVKCSHGATSGELDEDALFYMTARGIPEERARKMLIEAFLGDVLELVDDEDVRDYFSSLASEWLSGNQD